MKSTLTLSLVILATVSFLFTSCKKEETKPEVIEYKQPALADRENVIEVPAGLNALADDGDMNALMASIYIEMANGISSFGSDFYLPTDVERQSGDRNSVNYFWTYGGYSYWMTYKKESDKYVWTWDWETPDVQRFTYLSAEESLDGKSGSWSIYDPEAVNQTVWTYNWSIDGDGNFTASLVWEEDNSVTSSFNVVDNADGSGSFVYKEDGVKMAEVTWNSDGSGTYWLSDDGSGVSGSWTAGK